MFSKIFYSFSLIFYQNKVIYNKKHHYDIYSGVYIFYDCPTISL